MSCQSAVTTEVVTLPDNIFALTARILLCLSHSSLSTEVVKLPGRGRPCG